MVSASAFGGEEWCFTERGNPCIYTLHAKSVKFLLSALRIKFLNGFKKRTKHKYIMYIGILGGSFNPVHVGHIRLAVEALECPHWPEPLERVDFIPCATPPHKSAEGFLPFDLRVSMLKASIENVDARFGVNTLEAERSGPSYTWDTLQAYAHLYPKHRPLFILGDEAFNQLPHWHRWRELPLLADFGVVPRVSGQEHVFLSTVQKQWPMAHIELSDKWPRAHLPEGGRFIYMPLPHLEISASFVRDRWLRGGNVRLLMPEGARNILENERKLAQKCWSK